MTSQTENLQTRAAVLLPLPLEGAYDYLVPEGMDLHKGDIVRVPLGSRDVIGVVWGEPGSLHGQAQDATVDIKKLKEVTEKLEVPTLPEENLKLVDWIASYTISRPGSVLKMVLNVPAALAPPKFLTAFALGDTPEGFRLTEARQRVLDVLSDGPPRLQKELALEAGVGQSVVKGLADAGVLRRVEVESRSDIPTPNPDTQGPKLSSSQQEAAEDLISKVNAGAYSATLLDGVPGSGKTEVYFEAVAEALRQGKQILVLLPEIALGAQWQARFEKRFGVLPVEWHSDLTATQRRNTWRAISEGRAKVIVGARSALMLPYPDLGLIVVDEEHETSFKQEEGVIYNARDMAVVRGHIGAIPVVLASATPSLETVINSNNGRYSRLHLPERHGGALLPEVGVIDMRQAPPPKGQWLSPELRDAMVETLESGKQVLLYLNRRGYAPLTLCRTCGHRFQCPSCTAWLVEHRGRGALQCHHCGFSTRLPDCCPSCENSESLTPCGPGVERLAEEVALLFPESRYLIASSDNIVGPKAAAELVETIENGEVDIVIGTQIVAKGYHFPNLTLVGVVDSDLGLAGGDLRAAERTFQLLYQVAGRAGRGEHPGKVLLQTYMPEHPVMGALASGGRDQFIEAESNAREEVGMPPFGRLVALIVSGRDVVEVEEAVRLLSRNAPRFDDILVLGPAPAPLAILRGNYRHRFLVKAGKIKNIQPLIKEWLRRANVGRKVKIQVDVDPYSFM
ncbi:MAG: primosomal protein N' [Rhodospirillales bacterium]|nr:primosomal protein N' [Rhodospirillales bacterium]